MPDVDSALAHFRQAREHMKKAEEALLAEDPAAKKVLDAVTGEMTLGAIVKATDLTKTAAAQACSRLTRSGAIRRVRHGVYAPKAGAGEGSP